MNTTTYLKDHLEAYRRGDRDRAFFGLINRGDDLLPDLVKAFQSETDPKIRAPADVGPTTYATLRTYVF